MNKSIKEVKDNKLNFEKMTTITAADFMKMELENEQKILVRQRDIESSRLFLAGKYELEEGEILVGLEYDETYL
jgi:ribosomal protein L16/L10AE